MVQITYTLRLDMRDTGIVNTSLRLKQGDSGMKIAVNVFNGGVSAFDSSTTPKIVFRRADGASVMADMTVESSLYSYTLVGNELQVPGKELIDIKFPIGAEGRESTMSCSIEVVPDTITPNTHGSGIYDNDLAVLVEEATEAAETVQEVVGDSEAWANGERNGVPVCPDDPAYHNNSKYWSEQANPTALANLTDVDVDDVVNGDVLQYNSSTQKWEGKSISSGTNEIIAPVEGATSLHAYAVGKQLIYNNTLYKVIAPIAVNDALVVDTNIEVSPKTVIEQVEDNASDISSLDSEFHDIWKNEGAYNHCPILNTTQTINGVTWTVNSDGTVTANCSSNSHAKSIFWIWANSTVRRSFPYTVRVCGAPSGAASNTYHIGGAGIPGGELYTETNITANTNIGLALVVAENAVVDNIVFKPMITTDLNATYADFVPYAKTNGELTKDVKVTTGTITAVTNSYAAIQNNGYIKRFGHVTNLFIFIDVTSTLTSNDYVTVATISEKPIILTPLMLPIWGNGSSGIMAQITSSGNVQIRPKATGTYILQATFVNNN